MSDDTNIEGTKVPDVTFKTRAQDENGDYDWKDVTTGDLFDGKRVVVFGLPGAFTPTCSSTHLPGYETRYDDVKAQGIDEVYCVSVNDTFVMNAWAKDQDIKNVKVVPDGNGEFSEGIGMLVEKKNIGFGNRCWRYAMVVNDGTVEKFFGEAGFEDNHGEDPFEVSDVDTMLAYLESKE